MSTPRKTTRNKIQDFWTRIKNSTKRKTTTPSARPAFSRLKLRFSGLFKRFDRKSEGSSNSSILDEHIESDHIEIVDENPQHHIEIVDVIPQRKTFFEELSDIIQEDAEEAWINMDWNKRGPTGRFHSFRKKPSRRVLTRCSRAEEVVLDNSYPMQVDLWLSRSSDWDFDTTSFDLAAAGRCIPYLGMSLFRAYGLIDFFKLLPENCWKLFRAIEDCYHATNPYHNSIHAADVTQAVHCFLQESMLKPTLNRMELMVVLLAAITHDLDHPGVNHSFLVATNHPLAIMYKDHKLGSQDRSPLPRSQKEKYQFSPLASGSLPKPGFSFFRKQSMEDAFAYPCDSLLEHHHWRVAYSVILESGIFDHMQESLPEIKRMLKSLILATDITRQNEYLSVFKDHLKHKTLDMERADHRQMVLQMALKTADISNPGRKWSISKKWSYSVCDEFYQQGDKEIKLNLKVSNLCDREIDTVPKIQTGFFRYVVTPLFTEWHHYLKSHLSRNMLKNLVHNEAEWSREDRRSSQASRSVTSSDLNTISDADQVEKGLETSRSRSTMSFGAELKAYLIERSYRRASNSPMKDSKIEEFVRRYSMPLQPGLGVAPSKVTSTLELTFLLAKQNARRNEASAEDGEAAGPSNANLTPPVDNDNISDGSRRVLFGYAFQLSSDEESSSNDKGDLGGASVIIEESSLSSSSVPTGAALSSGSARVGLLSSQNASASNSEGHLDKQFEEDATREKGVLRALAGRRGSAPAVGALAARLAAELSIQLNHKHSASCHQWVGPETPVKSPRRGSLPAEVMTSISA